MYLPTSFCMHGWAEPISKLNFLLSHFFEWAIRKSFYILQNVIFLMLQLKFPEI